jgi:hypothetical protein
MSKALALVQEAESSTYIKPVGGENMNVSNF